MLMHYLWPDDFQRLAIYCLSHDIPEAWVGDIPAPVMWASAELKGVLGKLEKKLIASVGCPSEENLSPEDLAKLKACDRLELYIWCKEQWMMGNRFVADCMLALETYFTENPLPQPAKTLYEQIIENHMMPEQQGVVQKVANGS
jgi:5'-deoxynucleotidase YfbR-like HD superfamily hydrolase